jgi:small subunit ribosomal protein S18
MARMQHNDFDDGTTSASTGWRGGDRPRTRGQRRRGGRKKVCKFCAEHTDFIDYKDSNTLKFFLTDRGKVVPRRISGNCAKHQRLLTAASSAAG